MLRMQPVRLLHVDLRPRPRHTTLVLEHSETWSHYKTGLQTKTYATGHMEMTKKTRPQCVL